MVNKCTHLTAYFFYYCVAHYINCNKGLVNHFRRDRRLLWVQVTFRVVPLKIICDGWDDFDKTKALFLCHFHLRLLHSARIATTTYNMTDYETATAFIGEWGPFQQQLFYLLGLSIIPNGLTALSIVFFADTPPHRCLIPEHINLTAAWRNSSIPLVVDTNSGDWVPSKCSRYKLEDVVSFSDRGLLPGADVNLSNVATEGCLHGWEYDRSVYTSTITTEVCGWMKDV